MRTPTPEPNPQQDRCTHNSAIIGPQGQTLSCPDCEAEREAKARQIDQTTRRKFNENLRDGIVTLAAGLEVLDKAGSLLKHQEPVELQLALEDSLPPIEGRLDVALEDAILEAQGTVTAASVATAVASVGEPTVGEPMSESEA